MFALTLILLGILTAVAAFRMWTAKPEVVSMEECLARAWPVTGCKFRQSLARRHNAALILNVARVMQGASWFMDWDEEMRSTLAEMEIAARSVRRDLFVLIFDGVDHAYERMVGASTRICMRIRPDLVGRIERVL